MCPTSSWTKCQSTLLGPRQAGAAADGAEAALALEAAAVGAAEEAAVGAAEAVAGVVAVVVEVVAAGVVAGDVATRGATSEHRRRLATHGVVELLLKGQVGCLLTLLPC